MKNALLRTPFSAVALALGMLAAAPSFAADTKSVAVTAIVEHPALDAVRDGVKAELKASGYDAKRAAENIGAGYHTLAEAFSGWRDSSPHRANMLLAGATRMGIAAVYTPGSKYKVYWAMILAEPDGKN